MNRENSNGALPVSYLVCEAALYILEYCLCFDIVQEL